MRWKFALAALLLTIATILGAVSSAPAQTSATRPLSANSSPAAKNASPAATPTAAAAPSQNSGSANVATPVATPSAAAAPSPNSEGQAVLNYLGQVIQWYRHLDVLGRYTNEPAETLLLSDNRQLANRAVKLAFDYARADAALLKAQSEAAAKAPEQAANSPQNAGSNVPPANITGVSSLKALIPMRDQALAEINTLKANIQNLRRQLARTTSASARGQISKELASARGELELAQSRASSLDAMIEFESGSSKIAEPSGLLGQIEDLERTVVQPAAEQGKTPSGAAPVQTRTIGPAAGMLARAEALLSNRAKDQTLSDILASTRHLNDAAAKLRDPLIKQARDIDQQAVSLASQARSNSVTTLKQTKEEFDKLTARHKLVVDALLPLTKETVVLNMYSANLDRWRAANNQQFNQLLRALIIRLGGLALLILIVFLASLGWRELTFRYVQDIQRRHRLLALRRFTLIVVILLIIIFDFANEIGALATVLGFAAAGIALALQNVIMSVAGYFYVAGRFGIKVGDRVQVSGINGDVLEIGFFKMTLMELSNEANRQQPTGRIVVFPNSVVFQPTASFFKQAPGTSFGWNELRLTLAPDCDYRLAEKRLSEVVNQVFARYRESIQRQSHNMERELNLRVETPRPQTRLQVGESGIELVVRYPVQLASAAQTDDEISRRLVDTIKREGTLKLVAQGTPVLQPAAPPEEPDSSSGNSSGGGGSNPPTARLPAQAQEQAEQDDANGRSSPGHNDAAPVIVDQTIAPVKAAAQVAAVAAGVAAYDAVEEAAKSKKQGRDDKT